MDFLKDASIQQMLLYIGAICIVGVIGTIVTFKFLTRSSKAGFMPKQVGKRLASFCAIHKFKCYENISLQHGDAVVKIDYLVVGSFGAIIIQTLDVFGEIYGTVSEERWISVNGQELIRTPFPNPITEARATQRHLQGVLNDDGIKNVYFNNLTVVPANASLNVSNEKSIITEKQLVTALDKMKYMDESPYSLEQICEAIDKATI